MKQKRKAKRGDVRLTPYGKEFVAAILGILFLLARTVVLVNLPIHPSFAVGMVVACITFANAFLWAVFFGIILHNFSTGETLEFGEEYSVWVMALGMSALFEIMLAILVFYNIRDGLQKTKFIEKVK